MRILIDGDACRVITATEGIAAEFNIECHIYCDTKHMIESEYSEIHVMDQGADSTDFAILNRCGKHPLSIPVAALL